MNKHHLFVLASAATLAMLPSLAPAEMTLTRIATMPVGAEVTGISTNAIGDVFLNAQHPGGKNTFKGEAPPALVGYIAGFDPSSSSMSIPPEDQRSSVSTNSGEYVTFGKAGDVLGTGQVYGGVYDAAGELMYISNAPDFNGFISTGANSAYLYTGWEGAGRDGASAISKVTLSRSGGKWSSDLASSKMLNLSSISGGAVLCSGVVTPWGTPLLAEEYFFYNTATWNHPDNHDADERAGYQGGNDINFIKPKNMSQYLGELANPYRYGYMIEINNAASSDDEQLVKHFATGRLSHETAAIMPDNKTLYMSDDDSAVYSHKTYNTASGGVFFKFVADVAGDLSAGTLYAAKLTQDDSAVPAEAGFDVNWIELGHSNNAEIESWIAEYDDVTVADYVDGQTNYVSDDQIRAYAAGTAPDARAPFLESRRTAAAMGATNEWDKLEGVTTHGNSVYVAVSALGFTMDKTWGHKDWSTGVIDTSVAGDIALNAEACGATYVATTGDDYNITRLDPYVVGQTDAEGRCEADLPANPDNVVVLNDGTLLIGEDAGKKRHDVDMLWMVKN
jgi:secreted PhoX family phosphatase